MADYVKRFHEKSGATEYIVKSGSSEYIVSRMPGGLVEFCIRHRCSGNAYKFSKQFTAYEISITKGGRVFNRIFKEMIYEQGKRRSQ